MGFNMPLPVRRQARNHVFALALVWLMFLARGLFYIAYLPLWEGFDEWAHYAVIQNMAVQHEAVVGREERASREVRLSLELAPRRPGATNRELEYGSYWSLPVADRLARDAALKSLSPRLGAVPDREAFSIYEAQQAPLYYWVLAPVYGLAAQAPFLTRVWILRLFTLLIGSAVIPLVFVVAREVLECEFHALGAAAMVAATPQLMMSVNHIGNESLSIVVGTLFLFFLLRWKRSPKSRNAAIGLGVTLGAALLTKAYFLALVPATVAMAVIWARRHRAYVHGALVLLCPLGMAGWWYSRTWILTKSLSGEQVEIAGAHAGNTMTLLDAIQKLSWTTAADFVFLSHTWIGNWSFLVVRSWMYHVLAGGALLVVAGLMLRFFLGDGRAGMRSDVRVLLVIWASFAAGLGYQAARNFQATGFPGTMGYYLMAMVTVETILVVVGLEEIAPGGLRRWMIPGAVVAFAGLELFGVNFYSIPYYTGTITHSAGGGLPALSIHQLGAGGCWRMFERLAEGKPAILGPAAVAGFWVAFVLATVGLIVFAGWTASRSTPLSSAAAVQGNLVYRIRIALRRRDAGAGTGKDDSLSHTGGYIVDVLAFGAEG
jgi:hypothetical protein